MILKSIVVTLAAANVVYFFWAHGIGQSDEAPGQAPVQTLKLASEVPQAARETVEDGGLAGSSSDTPETGTSDVGEPRNNSKRCVTVGPFHDVSEAARAAGTLRAHGYDPRQRVVDGDVWAGVWVYLPVPATAAGHEQLLAKLKAAGIDDALEMPGPIEGSVISLGLFSEQRRAQARVSQAQALGLNPGVADRKRTGNVYWVDIDLKPTEGLLSPSDLQGDAGRISRLETKACPTPTPAS